MKYITAYSDYKLLNESLASVKAKYGNQFDNDQLEVWADLDPSPTKKYLDKMIEWFIASDSIVMVSNYINTYDNLVKRNLVDIKDINRFKTLDDFIEYVNTNKDNVSKTEIEKLTKEGAKTVYEDDDYLILHITTHEACMLYGKGTKWCITQRDDHYWKDYTENRHSTFYFFINKKLPSNNPWYKIAVQVENENFKAIKIKLWNAEDEAWSYRDDRIPNKLKKYFKYIEPPLKDYSNLSITEFAEKILDLQSPTKYKIESDNSITILTNENIKINPEFGLIDKIPYKINNANGNFIINNLGLTTLENTPRNVEGAFYCDNNKLQTLEGGPEYVYSYFCRNNNLITLNGAPKEVNGYFNCAFNEKLKSLKGGPTKARSYNCEGTDITTFEDSGITNIIEGLICNRTKLKTLKGIPNNIQKIECMYTQITNLDGLPSKIGKQLSIGNNKYLTSLEGIPQDFQFTRSLDKYIFMEKCGVKFTEKEVKEAFHLTQDRSVRIYLSK